MSPEDILTLAVQDETEILGDLMIDAVRDVVNFTTRATLYIDKEWMELKRFIVLMP